MGSSYFSDKILRALEQNLSLMDPRNDFLNLAYINKVKSRKKG
jgi:hypothetical protein